MLTSMHNWLTPTRRKAIYTAAVPVLAVLVALGVFSPEFIEDVKEGLILVGGVIAVLTNIMASVNTPTRVE